MNVYGTVSSAHKSLNCKYWQADRFMCAGHVFVQVCAFVIVCAVYTCMCDLWAPCQAAGTTLSFSLWSRRSLEQRSLILSTGACGLEACCCLFARPPLWSGRPGSMKSSLAQQFKASLKVRASHRARFLYRLSIGESNLSSQRPYSTVTEWDLLGCKTGEDIRNRKLLSFTATILCVHLYHSYCEQTITLALI